MKDFFKKSEFKMSNSNNNLNHIVYSEVKDENLSARNSNEALSYNYNEEEHRSKIFNKLTRNSREDCFIYNTMLMVIVNLNIAQFCFPYMVKKNGIYVVIIVVILLILFTYSFQKSILQILLANRNSEKSNYCGLVEEYLNKYCAGLLEGIVIIWFILHISLTMILFLKMLLYFIKFSFNPFWLFLLCTIFIFGFILVNSIKQNIISNLIPYICLVVQFISILVNF